jgi:hypothetical protein
MLCNRFWVENAWEMPYQTARTSALHTGVLSYCSRAASRCDDDAIHTALTSVPSQHDVACNDP